MTSAHLQTAQLPAAQASRKVFMAGAAATVALAALSFGSSAQAKDNVYWSVGVGSPGVALNVGNAYPAYPVYSQPQAVYVQPQPVYVQPQPVYVQPAPVYYQNAPVYYQPRPVYVQPQPVYYGRPHGWRGHHGGGYRVQAPRPGYGGGYYGPRYAPVHFQR